MDKHRLRMWSSLFRYLVLSAELSIPYHQATQDWLIANRTSFPPGRMAPVQRMLGHLNNGLPLLQFIRVNVHVFPDHVRDFLLAAPDEASLPRFLQGAREILEQRIREALAIRRAIVYPVAVVAVGTLITSVYRWKVLPTLAALLASLGKDLPVTLRFHEFVAHYYTVGLIPLAILLLAAAVLWKSPVRWWMERLALGIPPLRDWILLDERVRLLATVTSMSGTNIPWMAAMARISDRLRTLHCKEEWSLFLKQVHDGERWDQSVESVRFLAPDIQFVLRLLPRGGGDPFPLLRVTFDFYRRRREELSRLILRALEPALILLVGLWVGLLVYSMYRPLTLFVPLMP